MTDCLFELGTEELPSAAVWPLADALASILTEKLAKAGIQHGLVKRFATPRRLALLIQDVQEMQPEQKISKKGPALAASQDENGAPTPALLGFARSCGVTPDELTRVETDKGSWWSYESIQPGVSTHTLLPLMIEESIAALPIAKPMRWGSGDAEFSRPVHWAVLLWGTSSIPMPILGIVAGHQSVGHRFHHPQSIEIQSPKTYEAQLRDAKVIADFQLRRATIIEQIHALAASKGYTAVMPEVLIDEVTSIVEWPVALCANFDSAFLDVPSESLIASMQSHQKCFALKDSEGNLVPYFITISNIESNHPEKVIAGNEKVMRARLSDAAFFFRQDKKQSLEHHYPATAQVIYQAKLGSLQDKTGRMTRLLQQLAVLLGLNLADAERAAKLSKCDLMTGMVGEFPELQGLMGYYYALHDGETPAVAVALNEQYQPRFSADELPSSPLGTALSLADRIDTLVGIFGIGQKPTGMKDPFKLRRHALAVVRILIQTPTNLSLSELLQKSMDSYASQVGGHNLIPELKRFILERLQSYYQGQGVSAELILATRARQDEWLYDLNQRLLALQGFVKRPEVASLAAASKRVNNLLQQANIIGVLGPVDVSLLVDPAEKALFESLSVVEKTIELLYCQSRYEDILEQLSSLKAPVDAFFDQVMVMVDNLPQRNNRLQLLARLQQVLQGVADISLLVVTQ